MLVSVCLGLMTVGLLPQVYAGQSAIEVEISAESVGKYERLEFLINLDTMYANPYDPDEIDLSLDLKTPSGRKISIPGFYHQNYEQRYLDKGGKKTDWFYPLGDPVWKGRFAPDEVGTYSGIARLRDRNGTAQSEEFSFECVESQRKGFIRVSERDPRFFEFSEGGAFFPIGQNLAFIGSMQHVDVQRMAEIFRKMSQNGANFARIWTCCADWAMSIEARKSAWGRSWGWNPEIVMMPGSDGYLFDRKCIRIAGEQGASINVSPSHPVGLKPDTRYRVSGLTRTDGETELLIEVNNVSLCEVSSQDSRRRWTGWEYEFTTGPDQWWLNNMQLRLTGSGTAWLADLSLKEAGGGPELLWEAEINRPVMAYYNPLDCFILDRVVEAAEENGIYLQLCLMTRDLYMDSLKDEDSPEYHQAVQYGKKLLRYAVARWGCFTSVATWEYFNEMNPNLPTDRFYAEMSDYLAQVDPYRHLRATSAWAPCEKDWRHPKLDVADLHWYLRPAWGEIWKDEVASVIDRMQLLRGTASGKPALLSEFGLADDRWGLSPYMKQDEDLVHFHNSLWASALSGLSGTALFWWWEQLDMMDAYRHYKPLASFLADVPFVTADLRQTTGTISNQGARVIGLQGKECAYIWISNSQATWSRLVLEKILPDEIKGAELEIKGLSPGTYRVQWWDTYEGRAIHEENISLAEDVLHIPVPDFPRDVACRIDKPGR